MSSNINSENLLYVSGNVTLTLKNGSIQTRRHIALATNGAKIIIENGTYTSTVDYGFGVNGSGSKITMNGGKIIAVEGGIGAFRGGEIEVNSGEIEVSDNFALFTNGSSGMGGNKIVVNGGKFVGNITSSGYEAIGIYVANNDTFIMNGGEIIANGGTGLCMRGGTVTINDGKITATKTRKDGTVVPDGKIADKDKVMYDCSAIIYDEASNYPGKAGMNLHINGGIITGVDHSLQVLSNEAEPQVFVTGGTLTPAYPEVVQNETPAGGN